MIVPVRAILSIVRNFTLLMTPPWPIVLVVGHPYSHSKSAGLNGVVNSEEEHDIELFSTGARMDSRPGSLQVGGGKDNTATSPRAFHRLFRSYTQCQL